MGKFNFPKSARLHKRNDIQELFKRGSSFYLSPLKVLYLGSEANSSHRVLFSVSKRNFKKAVHRNLIKRRMREAYRLNRANLFESPKLQIAYIYTSKEIRDFQEIEAAIIESLVKLEKLAC